MPIPLKPCEGQLSEDLQEILNKNRNREQWADHPCLICGQVNGVKLVMGKWEPETHWPTVKYRARTKGGKNIPPADKAHATQESHATQETEEPAPAKA